MTDLNYGLSLTEVENSRAKHGINVLTPPKRDAWYVMLLDGFKDPLIVILLIAAAVSIALGFVKGDGIVLKNHLPKGFRISQVMI